ncbi:MAG TPA: aspartate aminotransferase family protein [Dongiaceae bacterium]
MSGQPLTERDAHALASLQKLRFFPLAVVGGEGSYLIAEDGRRLLDFSASWGVASLGHSHPAIIEAVRSAAASMAGASILSSINEPAVRLAEALLETLPPGVERKVWLGHSGSDANEAVVRLLRAATSRRRFIAFSGAYHGNSVGSMAVSGHPVLKGERTDDTLLIPFPSPYHDPPGAADEILADLRRRLGSDFPGREVAALFIEPIQSDGGMKVPPAGFLARLVELCRGYGILTVCDEVKVGLGRSGLLHCFEHEGFAPDFITFGKGLGGGLPLSAVVGPAALMDHATAFIMQTTQGNPVCCAAGFAVLKTIRGQHLPEQAARVGSRLANRLKALANRHPLVGDVRGRGLAIGVELVQDTVNRTPAKRETALTVYRAFERGLVLYYVGVNSNVLEFTPPLTLSDTEVDEGVDILETALADVAAGRVDEAAAARFAGW